MNRKDFMASIDSVINDWNSTSFSFSQKGYVPGLDDPNLTYGNGQEKKGVEINTCVLFVDIRNSVQLTKDKQDRTMGRLYSVFTQCMLLAAQEEGGSGLPLLEARPRSSGVLELRRIGVPSG